MKLSFRAARRHLADWLVRLAAVVDPDRYPRTRRRASHPPRNWPIGHRPGSVAGRIRRVSLVVPGTPPPPEVEAEIARRIRDAGQVRDG